jgi:YegS/Rv2252/BmrU family lipid kinase
MKHLFVINPASGKRQDVSGLAGRIREYCQLNNLDFDIYVTKAPLDANEMLRKTVAGPTPLRVYACGGDGTLNEVVNGAVGLPGVEVEVAHFPCGTGNDFIRTFGAHDMELFRNLDALARGRALPLDLIKCNARYGINICSVGIDARVNADVKRFSGMPLLSARSAYNLSLIVNLFKGINSAFTVRYGDRELTGSFAMVTACNGRYYGGGFNPAPNAEPDDGTIDFLIVKDVGRLKASSMVGAYSKGRYDQMPEQIAYYPGERLEISSPCPMVVI